MMILASIMQQYCYGHILELNHHGISFEPGSSYLDPPISNLSRLGGRLAAQQHKKLDIVGSFNELLNTGPWSREQLGNDWPQRLSALERRTSTSADSVRIVRIVQRQHLPVQGGGRDVNLYRPVVVSP